MNRYLSAMILGIAVLGLSIAAPATSQAQSVGISVGPVGVRAGYLPPPVYAVPPYPTVVQAPPVVYPAPYPTVSVVPSVVVRPGPIWIRGGYRYGHYWRR